ncbi:CHASE2 domain-containing protein [Cyanobacteria bacterium FACHB-DQ100]|nr:CHASE2 domain-containing protein [Cyanobacteria bacterium FACHB-DQ100]
MSKLVVLKIGEGSFDRGFPVILQIGDEGKQPAIELPGTLPPAPSLPQQYHDWQLAYRRLGQRWRIEFLQDEVTHVSRVEDCRHAAHRLIEQLNAWLNSAVFRPLRDRWFEKLDPAEKIRVLIQTSSPQLSRLPWHLWDVLDRYPTAEIALSTAAYERVERTETAKPTVNVLAILGSSVGINVQRDRALLEQLPQAHVQLLVEPQRQELGEQLWRQAWDILFFAGHSSTESEVGRLMINASDRLVLSELKYALKVAIRHGLKLAIFNSCDGIGLARQLTDLHIPQIIVMREPVPDRVAQEFLKHLLSAFAAGQPLYSAVRQAREQLETLEPEFPYATWLPVIFQNPAEVPQTWQDWCNSTLSVKKGDTEGIAQQEQDTVIAPLASQSHKRSKIRRGLAAIFFSSIAAAGLTIGGRHMGWMQPLELQAFDQFLRSRSQEVPDSRLLVVTLTEADIQAQPEPRQGSLSDQTLLKLLDKLEQQQPIAVGLDIYRSSATKNKSLSDRLRQNSRLITVCKATDSTSNDPGVAPPPEVPPEQWGFSDFLTDPDGILRRHLLGMEPYPGSACSTSYSFSVQLAFRYLITQGITPQFTPEGALQLGSVTFQPLENHRGGYQTIDSWGHQILLNYRNYKSLQDSVPQVTLTQLLNNQLDHTFLKDRIVLIGVTAPSFGDFWSTPYSTGTSLHQKTPGVLLQAQMVSQILSAVLDRRPLLWMWSFWQDTLWIWCWAIVGGGLAWWLRKPHYLSLAALAAIALLGTACFLLFLQGGWVPLVPALLALGLSGGITKTITKISRT